ncbi:hypothetical protein KC19_4G065000 [Ceratodon purpureus]|uniref:Large ribosomal subunit protein bL21m n=1 Tax=Ceratodon purpureus TaxID=3225 RepID=A0A8T0I7B6_CERPU|nr:hypothetical protein KC19_4G065000 [Ceratodon purpureus]
MGATIPWPRHNHRSCTLACEATFPMALAARLLSRRASRIFLSSTPSPSPAALASPDEALLLSRRLSTFSLSNAGLERRNEDVRLWSLFGRVYSTGVVEGGSGEPSEDVAQPIKPPPRPFKLNNEQRELAEEIGYKVVDRYTEEDFGQNKRPKAFAVVQCGSVACMLRINVTICAAQIGSHQFKVSPNDLIYTEKLKYCDINDKLMLNKVLMLGSKDQTIIGRPIVPKAAVFAVVEEHALDEKVIIFKKKRRKNYRRTTGHRQELTRLRILEVKGINVATAPPTPSRKVKAPPSSKVEETPRADSNTEILKPVLA